MFVCLRWSIVAVKELAGTLALTDEANWKHFASYIGFGIVSNCKTKTLECKPYV